MSTTPKRICVAGIALACAIVGVLKPSNFVFSGDAARYAQFVQARIRTWLITSAFAALALVVCMPVLRHGTPWQILFAIMFILLAALILVFGYGMLA